MKDLKATEGSNNDLKGSDVFENNISTRKCSDQTMTKKSLQPALSQYDIRISTGNSTAKTSCAIPIIVTKKRGAKKRSRVRQSLLNYFDKLDNKTLPLQLKPNDD